MKSKPVQQVGTWRRRNDRRLRTWGQRRWIALLAALAFFASGLLHVVDGGHAAFAASHSHDLASASQEAGGEPCCLKHGGEPHGMICSMANGCSLCAPVTSSAVLARPNAGPAEIQPDAVRSGRVPSSHFRPPKLFPNA